MQNRIVLTLLLALVPLYARPHELIYTTVLSGPDESPANASHGTGVVRVTLDFDVFTMRVEASFDNLQETITAAHIHAATSTAFSGTAGVATQTPSFEGFPTGAGSGTYDHTFDLTQASAYNPDFIAANGGTISSASNALFAALAQGKAYFNIHTTAFPGGEVRGFLTLEPTRISFDITGGVPTIRFTTFEARNYRVERKADLGEAMWTIVTNADNVVGTGNVVAIGDPDPGAASSARRFYQVILLP